MKLINAHANPPSLTDSNHASVYKHWPDTLE